MGGFVFRVGVCTGFDELLDVEVDVGARFGDSADVGGEPVEDQGVVHFRDGHDVPVERVGVDGDPVPVGGTLHPVGDDQVSVQLRVTGTRVPVVGVNPWKW